MNSVPIGGEGGYIIAKEKSAYTAILSFRLVRNLSSCFITQK